MGWWDWRYFPKAALRPKAVKGKSGKKFGLTWWGQKWVNSVESKGDDQRMARGRAYARAEKVFGIKLQSGKITAKVEGNYGTYNVTLKFNAFSNEKQIEILESIRNSPDALGAVMNNELPENLEKVCGAPILPEKLNSVCSCPDYANPCKHVAALYYVLADEIDVAPQILFALRGIDKETMFNSLTGTANAIPVAKKAASTKAKIKKKTTARKTKKAKIENKSNTKPKRNKLRR